MAAVHPSGKASPPARGQPIHGDVVYMLQASCPLSSIDCVTTVKTLVFRNPRHLDAFNRISHRAKPLIHASLVLGCIATSVFTIANLATGRVLAVASFVFLSVPLLLGFLAMRIDLVRLLARTYEFWFILLSSGLAAMPVCIYFGDAARSLMAIVSFVWYIRAFMVDANCSGVRATTLSLAMGAAAVAIFMLGIVLKLMPATHTVVLFRIQDHTLLGEDVALNGLGIVLLLLCRNAYRKHTTAPRRRSQGGGTVAGRVRLIGYRTRIQFVDCSASSSTLVRNVVPNLVAVAPAPASTASGVIALDPRRKLTQLLSATPPTTFHAREVVCPAVFDLLSRSWTHLPIRILSRLAPMLAVVAVGLPQLSSLAVTALVATSVYCSLSFALYSRFMLRLLLQSFDVQFLIAQHALAHITAACIFSWDKHCLLTLTSWLWISWLTTIDALTPIAKQKLSISRPYLALVFLKLLFVKCWIGYMFVNLPYENRAFFAFHLGATRHIEVKSIPFFIARAFATFCWTSRLVWRVYSQHLDELVVIQGAVEFDDYELYRKFVRRHSLRKMDIQRTMPSTANDDASPPTT